MLISRLPGFPARGERALYWLGQAGFWLDTGAHRILIDPYLSDSLAKKYAGQANAHIRMMPPPISVEALPRPDLVLITHAHTDHMDPETLGPLASRFAGLPFVVPRAKMDVARARIGTDANLIDVSDGEVIVPVSGLEVHMLPAAHETVERDEQGNGVFLGYGVRAGGLTVYHSGDCIPFAGLEESVRALAPDVALLPVNGRDAQRLASGVPGNFLLEEAIALCRRTQIDWMVPHHFGMFAFNTLSEDVIDETVSTSTTPNVIKPIIGQRLRFDI